MHYVKEALLAVVAGVIVAVTGVVAGPKHLLLVLLIAGAVAVMVFLLIEYVSFVKRLAHASPVLLRSPVVWRGLAGSRRRAAPAAVKAEAQPLEEKQPRVPVTALYVPNDPVERNALPDGSNCLYAHMELAAVSDEVLRRCHVRLVRVARTVDGRWERDTRFAASIRLKWAFAGLDHPEVEYRDIRPGEPAQLDVAFTMERAPGRAYIESLDAVPIGLPRDLTPGPYLLTVRALVDGHDPVDRNVLLVVHDGWLGLTLGSYEVPDDILGVRDH